MIFHVLLSLFQTVTVIYATLLNYDNLCNLDTVVFNKPLDCVCFSPGEYYVYWNNTRICPDSRVHVSTSDIKCGSIHFIKQITKLDIPTGKESTSLDSILPVCENEIHSRVKRDDTVPLNMTEIDEDFTSTGKEIGQEIMRNQMNAYIESVIARLTGLQGEGKSTKSVKYPVIKLLEYTKQIMQKTCTVVNADYFDLALNSFINLQMETYHVKEPYIGYSAFKRIEHAMTRCLQRATPHVFVTPEMNGSFNANPLCDNHMPTKASNITVLNVGTENELTKEIVIPSYGLSELEPGKVAEPLIESVWKMLVSTHSYCYKYFSEYYNDHHTYTVSLLPLFTNEIQDVWLNTPNEGKGYDLTDQKNSKLYGGMLGDVTGILKDIDLCTGASKSMSAYPWFMNRPSRDTANGWNERKKRSVTPDLPEYECARSTDYNPNCDDLMPV